MDRLSRANTPHPSASPSPSPQGEGYPRCKIHLNSKLINLFIDSLYQNTFLFSMSAGIFNKSFCDNI
ncbi:MAG: hypothetical protein ACI4RP_05945 [Acutalibacteraceae bacterium]